MAARPNQLAQRLRWRSARLLGALLAVALLMLPLPAAPVMAAFQDDPHSYGAVLKFEQTLANPFPGDGFRGGLDGIVSPSGVRLPPGHIYKIQLSYLDSWGGRVTYYTRNDRDASCDTGYHFPIGEGSQQLGFSALVPYQGDSINPVYLCLNYHIGWQSAGIVIRVYDVFANTFNNTAHGFATELALDSQHSYPDNLYQFTLTASGPITVSNVVEWVYHYNADTNAPPIDGDPLRTTSRMNVQIVVVPPGVSAGVTIYTNEARVFSEVGDYLFEVFSPSGDPGIALFSVETTPAAATSTPTSTATIQPPPSGCAGMVADVGQLPTQPAPPGPQPTATPTPCPATPSPPPTCGGTGAGGGVQDLPNAPTIPPPPGPQATSTPTPCPATPSPPPTCGGTGAGGGVQDLPNAPTIPPPPGPQPTPTSTPAACNTTTPTTPPTAPTCPISSFSRVSIPQRPAWQILPMELAYIVYAFRNTVLVEYPYNSGAYVPLPDTPVRWASLGAAGWYRFTSDDALAELAICNPPPASPTPTVTNTPSATTTATTTPSATASATATPTSSSTPTASPTASPVGTPYVFPTDVGGVVCVPTATAQRDSRGPLPDLALTLPTWQPLPTLVLTASGSLSMSMVISPVQTMVGLFLPPVATLTAWCNGQFGPDGWARGSADSTPLVLAAAGAFGWLTLFSLFGPLNWLLPPIVISLLVRVVRAILSMVKYVKQILPFQ